MEAVFLKCFISLTKSIASIIDRSESLVMSLLSTVCAHWSKVSFIVQLVILYY